MESRVIVNDLNIDAVRDIFDVHCGYTTQYVSDPSINFVWKHEKHSILYEPPNKKIICVYQSQNFDAKQHKTQETTYAAFNKLGGK